MKKIKVAVVFGGMSSEHSISVMSGTSVIEHMNKEKYQIFPIYIDTHGKWFLYNNIFDFSSLVKNGNESNEIHPIENVFDFLRKMEVVFPVLHGLYGEDGSIQGLFELLRVPYIGCGILSSSLCMDKAYSKFIFEKAGILQAKSLYIKKSREGYDFIDSGLNIIRADIEEICEKVKNFLGFPVFVKPSNSGSSIGINRAENIDELKEFILVAERYDRKILIEEALDVRELECAILEKADGDIVISDVGEILSGDVFYSFVAKYGSIDSKNVIPAEIESDVVEKIKKIALKAFKAVDAKILARVDFFLDKKSSKIYLNEINTIPGFTNISMYPQLFINNGISYENLIEELINSALKSK